MTNIEKKTKLEELKTKHATQLAQCNKVFREGKPTEYAKELDLLTELEVEYSVLHEKTVFDSLGTVVDALKLFEYDNIGHASERVDGVEIGIKYADKPTMVNLKNFSKAKEIPMDWYYEMQALNKRLTLRVASDLGVKKAEIEKIDSSFHMHQLAADIELGKEPITDSAILKHMQKVFDFLSPMSGKMTKYDLQYIFKGYSRVGRTALKVQCSNHKTLLKLMTHVMHRVVTGKVYSVDFKIAKKSEVKEMASREKVSGTAPKKAEKPAAKKSKKTTTKEISVEKPAPKKVEAAETETTAA